MRNLLLGFALVTIITQPTAAQNERLPTIHVGVYDTTNQGISGASVVVKDSKGGKIGDVHHTDSNGKVTFSIPPLSFEDSYTMEVSKDNLRMKKYDIRWIISNEYRITLEPERCLSSVTNNTHPLQTSVYEYTYFQPLACYCPCRCDCRCEQPTGEATLILSVSQDARVFINDRPTKSTGARRVYLSKGLGGGINYWYRVRVRIVRDGKVLEEIREVVLRAGDSKNVSVDFSDRNIPRPTDARPQRDKQRSK